MNALLGLLLGALAACGFVLARVVEPAVILHAFTYDRSWDPRLWLFFAGSFALSLPLTALLRRRGFTREGAPIVVVPARPVDVRLVIGSLVFGVGWGLAGACPGPAVAALGSGTLRALTFVGALLLGLVLGQLLVRRAPACGDPAYGSEAGVSGGNTSASSSSRASNGSIRARSSAV